jgi:hypothetical protein
VVLYVKEFNSPSFMFHDVRIFQSFCLTQVLRIPATTTNTGGIGPPPAKSTINESNMRLSLLSYSQYARSSDCDCKPYNHNHYSAYTEVGNKCPRRLTIQYRQLRPSFDDDCGWSYIALEYFTWSVRCPTDSCKNAKDLGHSNRDTSFESTAYYDSHKRRQRGDRTQ